MHISRIAIRNFRNFADVELADLGQTTVVVGENAAGKSNLLSALRLVLDPSLPDTGRALVAEDFWDGLDAPFAGNEIRVEIELAGFQKDNRAKALLADCLISRNPHVARLTYLFRPKPTQKPAEAREGDYESLIFGGTDESRRLRGEIWRYVALRVLPALRDAESDLQNARSPLRRLLARITVPPERLAAAANAIDQANDAILADPGIESANDSIQKRLREMVGPSFSVETVLGFGVTQPEQLVRTVKLFLEEAKRRSLDQASLGTANLIYLALLLEYVTVQEREKDTVATIIAVEEPEAHLHPHVQRVLFRDLLRGDRALMVTTHSPHVASVAPLDSLVLLRASDGRSQAFTTRQIGLTETQRKDLERYLDVTRAEILFAKGVILVEGIAEQYLIPAFAAAAGWDLDELGITVCSVQGTDFTPYQRLLGDEGLAIPHVVLTDGDPDKSGTPVGVGTRRVRTKNRVEIRTAIAEKAFDDARDLLAENDVFVGDITLEIDVATQQSTEMLAAFDELVSSELVRKRFKLALAKAVAGEVESRKKALDRIERVGKGRYAQRLAPHLAEAANLPPPYIAAALDRIRKKIGAP